MRISKMTVAITASGIVLSAVAGCGGSTVNGTPTATPAPPTPASATLPHSGAPGVTTPLDTKSIDTTPCTVATDAQIASIAGESVDKSSTQDGGAGSKACEWIITDGLGSLFGGTIPSDNEGLSSAYEQHAAGKMSQFVVMPPVDGYPAVQATNAPSAGYCALRVGLRNDLTYLATADMDERDSHYGDPCALATKIADLAIKHLQGA